MNNLDIALNNSFKSHCVALPVGGTYPRIFESDPVELSSCPSGLFIIQLKAYDKNVSNINIVYGKKLNHGAIVSESCFEVTDLNGQLFDENSIVPMGGITLIARIENPVELQYSLIIANLCEHAIIVNCLSIVGPMQLPQLYS